jgi:hypothetical protein
MQCKELKKTLSQKHIGPIQGPRTSNKNAFSNYLGEVIEKNSKKTTVIGMKEFGGSRF